MNFEQAGHIMRIEDDRVTEPQYGHHTTGKKIKTDQIWDGGMR